MNIKTHITRKLIACIGVLLIIIGVFISYSYWNIEPQETIGGFLCGLGFGVLLLSNVTLKK
jgi:CHASE3 domain sensor protein|tara:strand:+ start:61 stop:243 length:183 start_codon:yes stop_codon:yes gene_type:complete